MSTRDDLIAAKALIGTPEKWIKGVLEKDGCFCATGAARKAAGGASSIDLMDTARFDRYNNVNAALVAALPPGFWEVARYNDAPATTHPDIMALFQRAIDAAE